MANGDDKTIGQQTAGKALRGIAARNKALQEMAEPPQPKKVEPPVKGEPPVKREPPKNTELPKKAETPVPPPEKVVESKGPGQQSEPKVTETKTGTLKKLKTAGSTFLDVVKSIGRGE